MGLPAIEIVWGCNDWDYFVAFAWGMLVSLCFFSSSARLEIWRLDPKTNGLLLWKQKQMQQPGDKIRLHDFGEQGKMSTGFTKNSAFPTRCQLGPAKMTGYFEPMFNFSEFLLWSNLLIIKEGHEKTLLYGYTLVEIVLVSEHDLQESNSFGLAFLSNNKTVWVSRSGLSLACLVLVLKVDTKNHSISDRWSLWNTFLRSMHQGKTIFLLFKRKSMGQRRLKR